MFPGEVEEDDSRPRELQVITSEEKEVERAALLFLRSLAGLFTYMHVQL